MTNEDTGIKVKMNLRTKDWKKGVFATVAMFIMGILILGVGIYAKSIVGIIIGALSTLMFGYFTYLLIDPSQHVSMQMVKGEMSYKKLQDTISNETFEEPIQFLYGAGKPNLFLVSKDWVIVGDKIGTPVYIPKHKIKTIEILNDVLDINDDESYDGQKHKVRYCYCKFYCDEKHIFECGLIHPRNLERLIYELGKYLPSATIDVHLIKEDKYL